LRIFLEPQNGLNGIAIEENHLVFTNSLSDAAPFYWLRMP
jgi:hypothetical protein